MAANGGGSPTPTYQVGPKVWLSTRGIPLHVEFPKLAPRFIGPFDILKIANPVAVRLKLSLSMNNPPTFRVSRVKPVNQSQLVPTVPL